jgi:hypothetical protein
MSAAKTTAAGPAPTSVYRLASILRCTKCRCRLVGIAATGRVYRYGYYTCLGRQQYGRHHGCDIRRLTAHRAAMQALYRSLFLFRDQIGPHPRRPGESGRRVGGGSAEGC